MNRKTETVRDYCQSILESGSLSSKLCPPQRSGGAPLDDAYPGKPVLIDAPARDPELRLASRPDRLPTLQELRHPEARAVCLERFAHHELMAVELFAWALLRWPDMPAGLRRGLLAALSDEQRHLRLYLARLEVHGSGLGERPLSDYFWKHVPALSDSPHGPLAFLSAMGLTFEQANLDFTLFYRGGFERAGDAETAAALDTIHGEEIGHVRLAIQWLRRLKKPEWSDVEAYELTVPFPLGAARAKGKRFSAAARRRAGLSEGMIDHVRQARPEESAHCVGGDSPDPGGGGLARLGPAGFRRAEHADAATAGGVGGDLLLWPNFGAEEGVRQWSAAAAAAIRRIAGLWGLLYGPGARIVLAEEEEPVAWPVSLGTRSSGAVFDWLGGRSGLVPWLSTAEAAAAAGRAGVPLLAADPDIVHAVHDKGFALQVARESVLVPPELRPLLVALSAAELAAADVGQRLSAILAAWPGWTGGRYTLKPRLGSSGRGRAQGQDGRVGDRVLAALPRLARQGGAVLEPWLQRTMDLSVQLHVDGPGAVTLLGTTRQILQTSGIYAGNRGVLEEGGAVRSGTRHDAALTDAAGKVARAAAARGYTGPCGTDAFVYTGPDGTERLRPVVELNARFTTGTIAVGLVRRAREAGLAEGCRGWAFVLRAPRQRDLRDRAGVKVIQLGRRGRRAAGALLLAGRAEDLDDVCRPGGGRHA
jgi:uncharacterized ferritin-like protein (DUF455 family)